MHTKVMEKNIQTHVYEDLVIHIFQPCSVCTLLNEWNAIQCAVCYAIKPQCAVEEKKSDNTKQIYIINNMNSDCIVFGYLEKRSLHLKKLRKQWIVLKTDKCLYSYKTYEERNQKPTEIIDLKDFKYIVSQTDTIRMKWMLTLLSANKKTKRVFMTTSKSSHDAWNKAIVMVTNNRIKPLKKDRVTNQKVSDVRYVHYEYDVNQKKCKLTLMNFVFSKTDGWELKERVFIIDSPLESDCIAWYEEIRQATNNRIPEIEQGIPSTNLAKTARHDDQLLKIQVFVNQYPHTNPRFKICILILALYSDKETIGNVLDSIEKHLNERFKPLKLRICDFGNPEVQYFCPEFKLLKNKAVLYYKPNELRKLPVQVEVKYQHKVRNISISCEYLKKINTNNSLHCPIYYAMKEQFEFTQENLSHLINFSHFHDEYEEKPKCKYGEECKAYVRCENGQNLLNDNCHMKLYRHPPRTRNIELSENINSLIMNKKKKENQRVYSPTIQDKKKYAHNKTDGFLNGLIEEVINNGYKYDLCLDCGKYDECKHDNYSILQIVDDKMNHIRHKGMSSPLRRDYMLALILYTACECNYDLCATQREGNYKKWKWFDMCLWNAIFELSKKEEGLFGVYSGLNGVKMNKKRVQSGYFVTYVSTSWNKEVANNFTNGDGMIIQIDKEYKNYDWVRCCDVSWISRFPDECEVLFARSVTKYSKNNENFNCVVLDESNGIQTVSLRKVEQKNGWW